MLSKAAKIQRDSPTNIKLVGSELTPGSVSPEEFYQLSLSTGQARSENPVKGAFTYPAVICSSANFVDGRGKSMLFPVTNIEKNCKVAYESLDLERIEEIGFNILHDSPSESAVKKKREHMTRKNSPEEEKFSSKRRRRNVLEGERAGDIDERDENVGAADQSDSTLKVSSGDSDLTAERMAHGSSRTSSSSDNNNGCTLKSYPPPSSTTDASKTAVNQLSFITTEKLPGTSPDSGLHKSNIFNGQGVYRSDGFSSSSSKPVISAKDEDWLSLGLGCDNGSLQPKHLSSKPDPDMTINIQGSTISWIRDREKDDHREQPPQMFNAGRTTTLTTLLPPSSFMQSQQFSFHNITNSNSRPLQQGALANRFSLQNNNSDSTNLSGLNLLQPCSMEDQQRSQNIAIFPSVFPSADNGFKFQRQQSGETVSRSKKMSQWQGLYDRISEPGISGSTDLCFPGQPRIAVAYQGSHRFSQGWKNFNTGSTASYQNSETGGPAYVGLPEAGVLKEAILEKMQCRPLWNARDNFPSWCKPENGLASLTRPSASDPNTRKFPPVDRTLLSRQQLQYEGYGPPLDRYTPPIPFGERQRFSGASWAENVRIFRPSRVAQTGVWFALQALNDQNGDRMLPQIPKNYLRIKDATMTILVVKKYLVNKLGLNSESEIDIMCKGKQLLPSLTLQHVRDVMWLSTFKDVEISTNMESNHRSRDHLMVLHYQRNRVRV